MFMPAHCGSPLMTNDESRFTLEEYKLPASSEGNPYSSFVILEGSSEQARARHSSLKRGWGWGFVIVTVFVLFSCTDSRYDALLCQADSLMTANPDSAWALLSAVDSADMQHQRRSTRMRYELLRAEAQNKLYIDFTTDSVMRQVVRYYDRHGSKNEQLKAHYLLGCCYRDMHEAPVALLTWEDAVACADTTAADCDYTTLYRVYGQMAEIYFRQYMYEKELEAHQKYSDYALLAGDTLNYIRGLLLRNDAYLALGDTATVLANINYVRQLYLECGLIQQAAQVYPSAIRIALDKGEYETVGSMMQIFEHESGLFDEAGKIVPTREKYYYQKGRYYLGINELEVAESYFRRLLKYEPNLVDAYRGLLRLYGHMHKVDSTAKYAEAYEDALAKYLKQTKTTAIAQAEGMYDYSRQQQNAQRQEQKANGFRLALLTFVAFSIILAILVLWTFQKKKEEKRKLLESYHNVLEELTQAEHDTELLKQSLSKKEVTKKLIEEKEKQIQQLTKTINGLQKQIGLSPEIVHRQDLKEAEIVRTFHSLACSSYDSSNDIRTRIKARAATKAEWNTMIETIQVCQPRLYLFLQKHKLSDLKYKVCILSYLGFDNTDISTLTNANKGSVTNARTALAKELFNLTSAHELDNYFHNL